MIKENNFRGDLTDVSALTKTLTVTSNTQTRTHPYTAQATHMNPH